LRNEEAAEAGGFGVADGDGFFISAR